MANRYWVGGTGNWNTSNTTNWSATSGGAGGASIPTSSDAVFFDGNSGAGTVTVAATVNCEGMDFTGYAGTFGGSSTVNAYGSVIFSAGMTLSWTGTLIFNGTSSATLNTGGKTLGFSIEINSGATINIASDVVSTWPIALNNGVFNTNNFNITAAALTGNNSTTPGTWNLGSSTLTLTGSSPVNFSSSTFLTFNAGTSNISCNSTSTITLNGAGKTFYNVSFTGIVTGSRNLLLNGSNTFNNLSITAPGNNNVIRSVLTNVTQTVLGTLSVTGATAYRRVGFYAGTANNLSSAQATISAAAISGLTHTTWQNIILSGAVAPWTAPLGVVDAGNNSGITFDATPLYWVGGTGNWNDGTMWSTSSGGAAANVIPGRQTPTYIDASSGSGTITLNGTVLLCSYVGDINFTGYTGTFNINGTTAALFIAGNTTLGSGMTLTSTGFVRFSAIGSSKTITSNGKSIPNSVEIDGVGSTFTLQDAFSAQYFSVINGTFTTNNFNVTLTGGFGTSGAPAKTVNLGSSTVTVSGGNVNFNGGTINAGTSTIVISGSSGYFISGASGTTLYNVTVTGTSIAFANGDLTVNNLTFNPATTTGYSYYATIGNNITVNGTLTISGPATNKRFLVGLFERSLALSSASTRTITAAAVSLTNVDFYGVVGAGAATWSGTSIGNAGSNSGITFTSPKTVYWSLAAGGNLVSGIGWATSSGGTPDAANHPLPQDTAIIEDTGLNSGATLTFDTTYNVLGGLTFSTRTLPVTFTWNTANAYMARNITLSSAVTMSGTAATGFLDTTLNSAGVTFTQAFKVNGTLTLASNLTTSSTSGITVNETINFNNYNLSSASLGFGTNNYYPTPTISMGTGVINLTGTGTVLLFQPSALVSITGSKTINLTNSSSSSRTLSFNSTTPSENQVFDFNVTAGSGVLSVTGTPYFRSLDFTGFSGDYGVNTNYLYGSLKLVSGMSGVDSRSFYFLGTGSNNLTTANKGIQIYVQCGTGSLSLQDNFAPASSRELTITSGTFNTNNYAITFTSSGITQSGGTFNVGSSTVSLGSSYDYTMTGGAVNFGSSNFTCRRFTQNIGGTSTVTAGTSTITASSGITGTGTTVLYDVIVLTTLYGVSQVRNLTIQTTASLGSLSTDSVTVTGTFTSNGNSTYRNIIDASPYRLTPAVITAASVSLSNTDFKTITGAGAATWSGTSLADLGGNSGITFDVVPRTLYWVGGTGTWDYTNTANWSLSSGGSTGVAVPLRCDTTVFDANSGTGTVTIGAQAGSVNCSNYSGTLSGALTSYGNITLSSSGTYTFSNIIMRGYNKTITSAGKTIGSFYPYCAGGGYISLNDNLSCTAVLPNVGIFNTNGENITCQYISSTGSFAAVLNLGASVITLTASTTSQFNSSSPYSAVINAGTSELIFTNASAALTARNVTFNKVTYGAASGGGTFTIGGTPNTYGELKSTVAAPHTIKFEGASTSTVNNWNISGTAGNLVTVTSTTTSQFTLVSGGGTQGADYLNLSYSIGSPSSTWYAGLNSVNGGNNTGWLFEEEPTISGNGLFFGSNF